MGKKKKQEKPEKSGKQNKLEKPEKSEKQNRQEKPEKSEKQKKNRQKQEKSDKHDKRKKAGQKSDIPAEEKRELLGNTVGIGDAAAEQETANLEQNAAPEHTPASRADMAAVLRVFGDANRLQILDLLSERERSAGELLEALDIVQSTLSHHMKLLVESGLVKCRKQGKWSYYSIDGGRIRQAGEYLLSWSK